MANPLAASHTFSHCICQCSSPLAGPSGEKKTGHIRPSPNHPPQGRKRKHHTLDPFTDGGTMAQHGRHWSQPANRGIAPVPAGRRALSRSREGPQRLVGRKPPDGLRWLGAACRDALSTAWKALQRPVGTVPCSRPVRQVQQGFPGRFAVSTHWKKGASSSPTLSRHAARP